MMIPCDGPAAGAAAAILGQRQSESGTAQPAESIGTARRRRNLPAGFRRTGERRRTVTKQKSVTTTLARGERQTPRRREICNRSVIRQFGNHARQRMAFERLFHRPERIERTGDFEDQKLPRRQSEKIAARTINVAALGSGKVGLDPKCVAASAFGARSQSKCK